MPGMKYLLWLSLGLGIAALPARAEGPAIQIREVTLEKKALERPVENRDAQGQKRSYSEVTVVQLKGVFPPPLDTALDLFIGDYKIPEYGTTAHGVYFKVYDPALLERLKGKELRYRFGKGKIRAVGARFQPGTAQSKP